MIRVSFSKYRILIIIMRSAMLLLTYVVININSRRIAVKLDIN